MKAGEEASRLAKKLIGKPTADIDVIKTLALVSISESLSVIAEYLSDKLLDRKDG